VQYEIRNILYATDLGPNGPVAFRHALGLARSFGARLHILHVMEPLGEFAHSLIDSYLTEEVKEKLKRDGYTEIRREVESRLYRTCDETDCSDAERAALLDDFAAEQGVPFELIVDRAKAVDAELIVMGSRGHSALGEMLLGSVAHKVTMKSPVPVLLVPLNE
jgi:nucleotide-binding universal stress UspA family protein